jgi:uncharacterized protein
MSQQNVEAISSSYEAFNRGDIEAVLRFFHAEIEWQLPDGGINTGTYQGHRAVRQLIENYFEAFDSFRMEPEEFMETSDRIVVFVRTPVRGRGSGVEVEIRPAHVWTMRAGKALRIEVFPERQEALGEAVGLSKHDT